MAVPSMWHRVEVNLEALDEDSSDKAVDAASWLLLSQLHVLMPRLEPPDELDWAGLLDQLEP